MIIMNEKESWKAEARDKCLRKWKADHSDVKSLLKLEELLIYLPSSLQRGLFKKVFV